MKLGHIYTKNKIQFSESISIVEVSEMERAKTPRSFYIPLHKHYVRLTANRKFTLLVHIKLIIFM